MARIWSDEERLARWLDVELAALEGWSALGVVPAEAATEIRERAVPPTAERVAELEEVDYVVVTSGPFDLLVEAVCESDEHLLELLSERIRAFPGVQSTETFMYLKLVKQTYSWGVR